jgi:SAM-dependent methyltransferase
MINTEQTLHSIALKYPEELIPIQLSDIKRIAFHINLILSQKGTNIKVCDLGGGVGLFSIGCAALGMKSILVDDFKDEINFKYGRSLLELHQSYGVEIIDRDLINQGIDFQAGTIDAITTFDSLEHWHHSPKKLLAAVEKALAPGGMFVVGVPNCVNLRKRITVPLGLGKWSSMEDWYENEVFRGHVREPDVDDLHYIARDMGLVDVQIYGRNWLGYISKNRLVRAASLLTDRVLQLSPSLCSDIYMVGRKKP